MKIISKHKDYYDYLVGIYGRDEIMVYDRRTNYLDKWEPHSDVSVNGANIWTHQFAICNEIRTIYEYKEILYHTPDELTKLDRILKKDKKDIYFLSMGYWRESGSDKDLATRKFEKENGSTEINKVMRRPVLIITHSGEFEMKSSVDVTKGRWWQDQARGDKTSFSIPDLSTYGFAKWYPADVMYQNVVAFIGWLKDHPEIPNNQSNNEKIESNGFDTKISFRHRKK